MNLTERAHAQGIDVQTACRWYREGTLPVPVPKAGRLILMSRQAAAEAARPADGAGLYARVSWHDQRSGLAGPDVLEPPPVFPDDHPLAKISRMAESPNPIDHVQEQLRDAGYLADTATGTVVHLAGALGKPVLIEGPAGTGKTQLAKSVAEMTGKPLIRLQCYEGLDESKAIYEWDYRRQLLQLQLLQGGQQLAGDLAQGGQVHRRGEHVVGGLTHIHVIVGMDALAGQPRDHLVGVHVGRGA